jgi:hypothetical protein
MFNNDTVKEITTIFTGKGGLSKLCAVFLGLIGLAGIITDAHYKGSYTTADGRKFTFQPADIDSNEEQLKSHSDIGRSTDPNELGAPMPENNDASIN